MRSRLGALLFTFVLAGAAPAEGSQLVRLPKAALTEAVVRATGFNRDHWRDDVYATGYVDQARLDTLIRLVGGQVDLLDARAVARGEIDLRTLAHVEPEVVEGAYEDYHDYAALTDELHELAAAHADVMTVESAGRSVQGRELWVAKISDDASTDDPAEPKLLYVANMHGDETVGRELMVYLVRRLVNDYGTDARVTRLVDHAQIYVMPSMNPDGFERGSRENARGVDLNRDFPDFTSDPTDTPAGRAPETAAVMALHARHHFLSALNFHGGDVVFNLPWDTRANARVADRFADDPRMQEVARRYADANATMRANSGGSFDRGVTYGYEWYEIDGGMQDWSIHWRQSTHATIELSSTKYPSASTLPRFWSENAEALLAYLENATFGVHLRVVDPSGAPVARPTVRVGTLPRDVTYPGPYVVRAALAGAQTVRVTAPGYRPADLTTAPKAFDGTYTDVVLTPLRRKTP